MIDDDTQHPNGPAPPAVPRVRTPSDQGKDSARSEQGKDLAGVPGLTSEAEDFPGFPPLVERKQRKFFGVLEARRMGFGTSPLAAREEDEQKEKPVKGQDSAGVPGLTSEAEDFPGFPLVERKQRRFFGVLEARRMGIGTSAPPATEEDERKEKPGPVKGHT